MKNQGLPAALVFGMIALLTVGAVVLLLRPPGQDPARKIEPVVPTTVKEPANAKRAAGSSWDPAPPCANAPVGAGEWQRIVDGGGASARTAALWQRAAGIAGATAAEARGFMGPSGVSEYQALLFNVATGRLNRATQIFLKEYPDIKTVGDLLSALESREVQPQAGALAAGAGPVEKVLTGEAIVEPVCAKLVVLQRGSSLDPVVWTKQGVQAQAGQALAIGPSVANSLRASLDFGTASPDGKWAAYTSLNMDAGGPVFVQNLQDGSWTNLIDAMNAARSPEQPAFDKKDWWTVIKWFPDSRRIFIGRSDASSVIAVQVDGSAFEEYPFPGEGSGGAFVTDLAPDGSGFAFIGYNEAGDQVLSIYSFADGSVRPLLKKPLQSGVLYFPRFSPDGSRIAYLEQQGDPQAGLSYSIHLLTLGDATIRELAPGNVGLTVPMWSPDGAYVAYTRGADTSPQVVEEGEAPEPAVVNVWAAQVASGQQLQLTATGGQARSPVWSTDGTTLAFITQEGEVGMSTVFQPGRMWLAAQADPSTPLLTSAFFVP